jgi:hypothetical protein
MTVKDYTGGIKVAFMLNSLQLQKWQYQVIESLLENREVEAVLIIRRKADINRSKSLFNRIISYPWQHILFRIFYRYLFHPSAFRQIDAAELLKNLPVLDCIVKKKKISEYFTNEDIESIKSFAPDFILKFGFGILKGDILTCTPMGIWSFHHGDEQKYRGVPPGFWEIYQNDHKSGAILQRLTEKLDSGVILRKGLFKTIDHSWTANLDQSIYLSRTWPADVCKEVIAQGTFPDTMEGVPTNAPVYRIPGNTTFVLFLIKLFFNKIRFHFRELFYCEVWQLGIIKARTADILSDLQYEIDLEEVDFLAAKNNDHYFADGFMVKDNERLLLLYEDYTYKTRKGHISAVWFNERDYSFSETMDILEEPWHLSYPFILRYNNTLFCIPESKDHKSVELYKLDVAQMKMIHHRTLVKDLEAVDPTLIFHQNWWYLFFTSGHASNVELHIWHAEHLEDEFTPHILNPVKSNIANARPAGPLFYLDGKLYRPAQDCSKSYGGRIIINEVKILTEDSFLEMAVNVLEPPKGYQGLHNLSFAGDSMLFDCKRMGFSWENLFYQLKKKSGFIK